MNMKTIVLFIFTYALALYINFMPSIKYPDLDPHALNLTVTLIFMLVLVKISYDITTGKVKTKKAPLFFLTGAISGVVIFIIKSFENMMFQNVILDSIAALQYPLYVIFITPMFGANILFDIAYEKLALFMSVFYLIVFMIGSGKKFFVNVYASRKN
ncbi:hypothetical protein LCL95_10075 [Bacillus timonensis]|nr:hypothetical protein [Bacillus timonensis]